jgi:hypothetical protein
MYGRLSQCENGAVSCPRALKIILLPSGYCAVGNAVRSLDALKQEGYALSSSNACRANAKLALSPPGTNKQSYQLFLT